MGHTPPGACVCPARPWRPGAPGLRREGALQPRGVPDSLTLPASHGMKSGPQGRSSIAMPGPSTRVSRSIFFTTCVQHAACARRSQARRLAPGQVPRTCESRIGGHQGSTQDEPATASPRHFLPAVHDSVTSPPPSRSHRHAWPLWTLVLTVISALGAREPLPSEGRGSPQGLRAALRGEDTVTQGGGTPPLRGPVLNAM